MLASLTSGTAIPQVLSRSLKPVLLQRGLNRAEDDAEDLRKKTGALRGENEALSDDKDALVHLQAGLQEERDELERDNSALRDELSALRAGTGSNNGQQLDALGDENENLRRALREKSQELEASELVERSARRDLGAKDFERDNLAFENEKLHKKVSKLKREMDRLRDKLEDPPAHSNRRERLDISAVRPIYAVCRPTPRAAGMSVF